MQKIASENSRNLFLTARKCGANFRAAAKWFTHRTSLTRFVGQTAGRSWRAALRGRGCSQMLAANSFLRQLVRDYSLKRKSNSARVLNVDADRFGREIVVGTANSLCFTPLHGDVGSLDGFAGKLGTGSRTTSAEVQMEVSQWLQRQKL